MSVTSRVARRGIKPCPIETSGRLNWVTARERESKREKERESWTQNAVSLGLNAGPPSSFSSSHDERETLSSELGW